MTTRWFYPVLMIGIVIGGSTLGCAGEEPWSFQANDDGTVRLAQRCEQSLAKIVLEEAKAHQPSSVLKSEGHGAYRVQNALPYRVYVFDSEKDCYTALRAVLNATSVK